jgi:molybdate transport system ATP-binding protein
MSAELRAEITVRAAPGAEHPFSLEVAIAAPPGVTILFGPSGSGKSTTLAAIAGLVRPDAGRIAYGDDVWFDRDRGVDHPVHERGLAFVFQSLALFPHMTAEENVAYGIDRHVAKQERTKRARAMLERMRVAHLASRKPRTFSGGEAQRVALARAFARSPKVVLLDEPFSALDRELRHELCADVKATVAELAIPAILVTHHRHEARSMGDRIVVLREGRVTLKSDDVAAHLPVLAEEEG